MGEVVDLTPREFAIVEYLMRRRGEVVPKADILAHVWDFAFDGDDNVVEVHVSALRRKLGPATIETVRGAGYRIVGSWPGVAPASASTRRVTAFATLVLAVALVVAAVIANGLLVRALTDDVDASLENRLDQVLALTVEGAPQRRARADGPGPRPIAGRSSRTAASSPPPLGWPPAPGSTWIGPAPGRGGGAGHRRRVTHRRQGRR